MVESEITIGLLREIRDELKSNRIELKAEISELRTELKSEIFGMRTELTSKLDITNARLDITNARLEVVERTVNDAATQIIFLGRYIKNRADVDIADLELRVSKLEAKLPD